MSTRDCSQWGTATVLAALLVAAYVAVLRPARVILTCHLSYPSLEAIETERAQRFRIKLRDGNLSIGLRSSTPSVAAGSFRAPAGILFLLPALFLVAFFPYRPYWLYIGGFHLVLGALQLGAVVMGLGWTDWGFTLNRFLNGYLIQGGSLAVPILALYLDRDPSTE